MTEEVEWRVRYNVEVDWNGLPKHTNTLENQSPDVEVMRFRREKNSHRGLSRFKELRKLVVFCANQECLEEVSELPRLETLYISETRVTDLLCLRRCRSLKHLIVQHGTKIDSLSWLSELAPLDSLRLENLKRVEDISVVETMPSLKAFGIEGSIWFTQRVKTFQPLVHLPQLKALFLLNCRSRDDGLTPLREMKNLLFLDIAAFFPDAEFLALTSSVPNLECRWFSLIDKYGGSRAAIKAMTGG